MACTHWKVRPWWNLLLRPPRHRVHWWKNEHFQHQVVQVWLDSDEARGFYDYSGEHLGDDDYQYTWRFTDSGTAFVFKMKFG